jgi:hypothetical protein
MPLGYRQGLSFDQFLGLVKKMTLVTWRVEGAPADKLPIKVDLPLEHYNTPIYAFQVQFQQKENQNDS